MAMNVTPFQSTDEFTMAGFNGKISDINSGVDTEITSALSGFARIETGSYVGTGTYGQANPNTLTFGFVPKFVFVSAGGEGSGYFLWVQGCSNTSGEWNDGSNFITASGNTLSWYNTADNTSQRNVKGWTYYYIAIG